MSKKAEKESSKAKADQAENDNAEATAQPSKTSKRKTYTAKVTTTFRHLDPSAAIQAYAERKFGHLARFIKRDATVHLILSVDKYRHCGEATLKVGGLSLKAAREEGRDLYAVIDALVAKVKRQLTEEIRKLRERKTRALSAGKVLSSQLEAETSAKSSEEE